MPHLAVASLLSKFRHRASITQAVNSLGVRRARYHSLTKTHLHYLTTAAPINFTRVADWLSGYPPETIHISPFVKLAIQT